jgi:hypothetical protein
LLQRFDPEGRIGLNVQHLAHVVHIEDDDVRGPCARRCLYPVAATDPQVFKLLLDFPVGLPAFPSS